MWAFFNLKALKIKEKLKKFTGIYENVYKKHQKRNKMSGFSKIKQYSLSIVPTKAYKNISIESPVK